MDTDIDHCYDDHLMGDDLHLATTPKYVKGVGRGKQKPVDPLTIRLPKFLLDLAIEKSNKLKTKSSAASQINVNIKRDCNVTRSYSKYYYDAKTNSRSSHYDTSFFDWHIAKLRNAEQFGSSSTLSTASSSTDDVNVISLKDTIKWPSIDSVKTNSDSPNKPPTKKEEVSLGFKSIGQLLCGNETGTKEEGCHGGENAEKGETKENHRSKEKFKLCVQNIPYTLTEDDLLGALSIYGDINDCQVFRSTGNHSMAIVIMNSQKACEWAISCLHGEESPFPGYPDGEVPDLAVFQIKESDTT